MIAKQILRSSCANRSSALKNKNVYTQVIVLSLKILNHEHKSVHVQFKTYQWNCFQMIFNVMFTTNHYSEQDVKDAMEQMEQRWVTIFVLLHSLIPTSETQVCGILMTGLTWFHSSFKQRYFVAMITKCFFSGRQRWQRVEGTDWKCWHQGR